MRVRAVVVAVLGGAVALGLTAVAVPASAEGSPVFSGVTATNVVLDALGDATTTVDATIIPANSGDTITSADVLLSAGVFRDPADWAIFTPTAPMTTTDGVHYEAVVLMPRDASPGPWNATVSATDSANNRGTATTSFTVVQKTFVELTVSPPSVKIGLTAEFSGRLLVMAPVPGQGQEDGTTVPYPGKAVHLTWPDNHTGVSVTTDGNGEFSYRTAVRTDGLVTASFAGTVYRAAADPVSTAVIVARNATRLVGFNAHPEPVYRNGYITVSGRLERLDPFTSTWVSYSGKQITITRQAPPNTNPVFQDDTTTDSRGYFSLTMHGSVSTIAGTWHASFEGTVNYASLVSRGDTVITMTAPMRISRVVYNPPGDDNPITDTKLNAEYVRITNDGNQIANLRSWVLHDAAGHTFTFATSVYVAPGHSLDVHTGPGTDTSTQLYWQQGGYIWNNGGDTATLENDRGSLVDSCSWGDGSGVTSC